ncbi:MAG: S8 family serine peptidase [Saprospiraceae bacterium]|nr:S8 family serine peptidase [Saprospiraceae bacterium]
MKKNFMVSLMQTCSLIFSIFLLNFSFSFAQGHSADKMLIQFDPGTASTDITNFQNSIGAVEVAISPVSNIRLWHFPTFATAYANHGWIDINEVVNGSGNVAIVNSSGLNFFNTIPSLNSGANNSGNFNPIATCPYFSITPTAQTPRVKVAILDTGIGYTGPNHAPIFCNQNLFGPHYTFQIGYDYVNNDTEPRDDHGHGTHIAGIVAQMATLNSNFDVQLFAFKTHDNFGEATLFNVSNALDMAVLKGIKIVNMSFSYPITAPVGNHPDPFKIALDNARDAGVLIVASAGNLGGGGVANTQFYPAAYDCDNILSVASISCLRTLSTFSTWSATSVDVAMLGENIQGPHYISGNMVLKSGTSQAAGIVTGIAAQLASNMNTIHYAPLKCSILEGAQYDINLEGLVLSEGYVNAEAAYAHLMNSCAPPPGGTTLGSLPGSVTNVQNEEVLSVYPNPFESDLTVSFKTEQEDGEVIFTVTNAQGSTLYAEKRLLQDAGEVMFSWNPNGALAPGLYFARIQAGGQTITKKVIKE